MHDQPFDRLVQAADEMASFVEELVVIQRAVSGFTPASGQYRDFVDGAQMQKWLSEARIVVSHSGAGSILSVLQAGKPLVLVPRLKRFDEHFDDHQLELTKVLSQQGRVIAVMDLSAETLWQAIVRATQLTGKVSAHRDLQVALRAWLDEQAAQPRPRRWWLSRRHRQGG
jgi:beta-1,4-N-acetylglucosaminyltransferase